MLVQPSVYGTGNSLDGFTELAAKIAPLGWHVQFLAEPAHLSSIAELRNTTTVPFVLDHIGGGHSKLLFELLARDDVWVKLSGFYRLLPPGEPYAAQAGRPATSGTRIRPCRS